MFRKAGLLEEADNTPPLEVPLPPWAVVPASDLLTVDSSGGILWPLRRCHPMPTGREATTLGANDGELRRNDRTRGRHLGSRQE
jgi:hypothetical protein